MEKEKTSLIFKLKKQMKMLFFKHIELVSIKRASKILNYINHSLIFASAICLCCFLVVLQIFIFLF